MEINRALASLLRLQELDDFVRQAEKITTRELFGFNDLPRSISTELSAQLSAIPSLKATEDALDSGFPILIRPILDYDFSVNSKFKLGILTRLSQDFFPLVVGFSYGSPKHNNHLDFNWK